MRRWTVLASDFDGTLATSGRVPVKTLEAVSRFRDAGGTFVLVTGRRLPELYEVFPETDAFVDLVVAENGGVLHDPASPPAVVLAAAPPVELKDVLVESGAIDVEFGEVLVSASRDDEQAVRRAARQLGSTWSCQVVPNRDRVMLMPKDVDKGTGLGAAAAELGVSLCQVLAIGDGENDVHLLRTAGFGVAVADAVPILREHADVLTSGAASEGVVEAIEWMLSAPVGAVVR